MNKTILILAFTFSISFSFAQNFSGGILLGVSGSQIDGDVQGGYKKGGLIIGAYVSKPLSEKSNFKIESYYIGKGAVKTIKVSPSYSYQEFNTSLHYIEMPFLYHYKLLPKFDVSIGLAPSYIFASKLVEMGYEIDKNFYSMRTFDVQPIAEAGFYLTDNIVANIRYSHSVINIRTDTNGGWYNNNIGLVLSYEIK